MRNAHTNSGHGQSGSTLTRALAASQEIAAMVDALGRDTAATVYRIYTEDNPVVGIVTKYFRGASLFHPTGIWDGLVESGLVIEIVDTFDARAKVVKLAAEIADTFAQDTVLLTWQSSHGFERVNVYGTAKVSHGKA